MALATLTGNTNGGVMVTTEETTIPENLLGIELYWAPEKKQSQVDSMIETASGIKFQRQHFPPDSRSDCWFCLASEGCEKHLITSVHNQCYLAMPKGPIHPGHILIVPVTHSSRGAWLESADMVEEVNELKKRLAEHASEQYDCDLFVWERAIQTKGGYHTHVQCVPIARDLKLKLEATLQALAKKTGFVLREINSDLGIKATLLSGQDEESDGYFYAEIMAGGGKDSKRFLNQAASGGGRLNVPLQFGREVLAIVQDNPDFAHWKACVLDQEKETELAADFRKSFQKYEP
jgi:diadenosine tetraphosphate (Ap4A) HIT family hydrolase